MRAHSVEQVMELLGGRSRGTIYQLINSGQLKSFKDGKRRLVTDTAIEEYLKQKELVYAAGIEAVTKDFGNLGTELHVKS